MRKSRRILNGLIARMNNMKLHKKLMFLYIFCMLLPLVLTDSAILGMVVNEEKNRTESEMKNTATAVVSDLDYIVNSAMLETNKLYIDSYLNSFMETKYQSVLEYYVASYNLMKANMTKFSTDNCNILFYADNETIINGGHFFRLSACENENWYSDFQESEKDTLLYFYYAGDKNLNVMERRKISLIRRMNFYKNSRYEKIVKYDFDYNYMVRQLTSMNYSMPVYICNGDRILYTNRGYSSYTEPYVYLTGHERIGLEKDMDLYGMHFRILVLKPQDTILSKLEGNLPLVFLLVSINTILPLLLMNLINASFVSRLRILSGAFEKIKADSLSEIHDIQGTDEIAELMENYNRMVQKSQELIKTVYKDKLERQEIDLARKNAELLALHSQINPHFLFNMLESIRMHCVLKGEQETSVMIERLAALERQNVEWVSDYVKVNDEVCFIRDYFELQKYRFGDRLCYEIDIADDCKDYYLPRLTLTTFSENACIHGVERKSTVCWIYVRVYRKEDYLILEIEDTGNGIEEEMVDKLKERIRSGSIESLKEKRHIGMVNAFLRLRMITNDEADFEIESEIGVGTFMILRIPVQYLTKERGDQ